MPRTAVIFILGGLGAMAVPATSGFIAEVMVFLGAYSSGVVDGIQVFTIICLLGILLAAAYILWTVQRVFFGLPQPRFEGVHDADRVEQVFSVIFIAAMFVVGLYPRVITDVLEGGLRPVASLFGGS
jgi:NADH-quinone oxidoreductase subunit M